MKLLEIAEERPLILDLIDQRLAKGEEVYLDLLEFRGRDGHTGSRDYRKVIKTTTVGIYYNGVLGVDAPAWKSIHSDACFDLIKAGSRSWRVVDRVSVKESLSSEIKPPMHNGATGLKMWVHDNIRLDADQQDYRMNVISSPGSQTRTDGVSFVHAPYIRFSPADYADLVWNKLKQLPHRGEILFGPMVVVTSPAIVIGKRVYCRDTAVTISVYTLNEIARSNVISFDQGTDDLLLGIIRRKLDANKVIKIDLPFGNNRGEPCKGTIVQLHNRDMIYVDKRENRQFIIMATDTDNRLTIRDIDGFPTLVPK